MDVDIRGFLPQSLVDYPDNIAAVVFTAGCNMSCPFCYNKDLVRSPEKHKRIDAEEMLSELGKRKGFIDGVVITGGEPTLQKGIGEFMDRVREMGLLVKLDTNGLDPVALEALLPKADYVAMDVKAAKKRYREASGVDLDFSLIEKSIGLLMKSGKEYEFRTTVVPQFIPEEDFESLTDLVRGADRYYVQQYRPIKEAGPLSKAYDPEILTNLAEIAGKKVKKAAVRGI